MQFLQCQNFVGGSDVIEDVVRDHDIKRLALEGDLHDRAKSHIVQPALPAKMDGRFVNVKPLSVHKSGAAEGLQCPARAAPGVQDPDCVPVQLIQPQQGEHHTPQSTIPPVGVLGLVHDLEFFKFHARLRLRLLWDSVAANYSTDYSTPGLSATWRNSSLRIS